MTAISPCFRLADATWPDVSAKDESAWIFGAGEAPPPLQPFGAMKDRFVYVFQSVDNVTNLHAEYEIDRDGNLGRCEGSIRMTSERGSAEAVFVHPGSNSINLPDNVNGKKVEYFFFATRIRLTSSAIVFLRDNKPKAIPLLNVAAGECRVSELVPVVDPLFAARQLNLHYQQACNALLDISVTYAEQNADLKKRVEERNQTLLLATLLKRVIDGSKGSAIRGSFKDGSGNNVKAFIDAHNKEVKSLNEEKDRRGAALTKFLNSDLMRFTEDLYAVSESTDFHAFLNGLGPACERLNECPNGRARLGDWIRNPPHWLKTYVLPDAELQGDFFQVARKSFAAVCVFWAELAPALATENPQKMPEIIGSGIQRVTKRAIVTTRQEMSFITRRYQLTNVPITAAKYNQLSIPNKATLRDIIADWASSDNSKALNEAMEHIGRLVECVNLILATTALFEAESDTFWKGLNLVGAGFDTVGAYQALGKLKTRGLRVVAACSAAIDAVLAAKDGFDAYQKGDTSALIGFTSVSLGSTLIFMGWVGALAGGGASATIVGLPAGLVLGVGGAILVAAGYILAVFTEDSDLETFIKHCYFGGDFGEGSANPKWAGGELSSWKGGSAGLTRQVTALYNLLAGYSVEAMWDRGLRISPGLLSDDANLRIDADIVGTGVVGLDVARQIALEINPKKRLVKSVGKDEADVTRVAFITDANSTLTIEVELFPKPGTAPSNSFNRTGRCEGRISLDLFGDSRTKLPNSGALPFNTARMVFPFNKVLASKDF